MKIADGRQMKQGRGVIERFREFLPPCKAIVSLGEGNTPLVFSPKLSARVGRGCEVYVKNEGMNPTGSFKDRGMTVAVSRAIDRGARTLICASTGNTSASAAAYAARAGIPCAVVLPAGKIASGKLIQAFAHGAKIVAIEGNFDDALRIVRELGEHNEFAIVNSLCSPSSRTIRSASSKLPSIATIFAPCANAWINFPLAIFPAGKTTAHGMPARAA